jgi:hypothetical protein
MVPRRRRPKAKEKKIEIKLGTIGTVVEPDKVSSSSSARIIYDQAEGSN